ncbi:MAG: ABC-type nitrate/sulfonate/bicarbonate transport system periplasmic component-like protein [Bradyrhizobium sp.]|nr:ABC-type nitrate/sulfonate/bicarbonate transport system periplasmic component-like protein [Bradyrhizobium sp.]
MKIKGLMCAVTFIASMLPSIAGAETTALRLGFIAGSAHLFQSVPLFIAQQKGMLKHEGIELEVVPLPGVDHMITELDEGRVDISSTALPYLIKAVLNGSDAVAVVGGPANTVATLVSRPEIETFAALKGKTIGLSLPVDVISIGTRELLAKHGLQGSDYTTKELIGTPVRAKCLDSGDCAAVALSQPDDILFARKGYHRLGNTHEVISDLQFTVFAARRGWASDHKDELIRFARAIGEAYRFMADPANREEVIAMGITTTGAAPDVVAEMYKLYYEPYIGALPKHGEISMPGISKTIELLGGSGELQKPLPLPGKFVDLQFLKAAGMQ